VLESNADPAKGPTWTRFKVSIPHNQVMPDAEARIG
jgi:hypothetical protein